LLTLILLLILMCYTPPPYCFLLSLFNATTTTEIYTLSLHDALPICTRARVHVRPRFCPQPVLRVRRGTPQAGPRCVRASPADRRSEEHTSELQSRGHLVCRLLLEKKKKQSSGVRVGL